MIDFVQLAAEFPPEQVSWRVGSTNSDKTKGLALAYIDSRDVMERLDEVCTPACWGDEYPVIGQTTLCKISIKCGDEWVSKCDGAGSTDVEAEKGQLSDAMKRSAVKWGIGRYLYGDRFKNVWVDIEPAGRSFKIKQSEYARLAKIAAGQRAPELKSANPPSVGLRVKNFEKAMDDAKSMVELDKVIKNGNALLLELHKSLPQAHDELQKKISQHQEAFQLAETE
jgi:hypothetical protein